MQTSERKQQIRRQVSQNHKQLNSKIPSRASHRKGFQSQEAYPVMQSNQQSKINQLQVLHIETSDVDIPNPQMIRSSQDLSKLDLVQTQNVQLKKINNRLKQQLYKINEKLDTQLARKNNQQQKKAEIVRNFQLKNAYKRCQIMKKELRLLKKKDMSLGDEKNNSTQFFLIQKTRENEELRNQIKSLKSISKFQQKGLIQLSNKQYFSQAAQIQRLKGENKKLHSKVEQFQRRARLNQISLKKEKRSKQYLFRQDVSHRQQLKSRIQKDVKVLRNVQERDNNKIKYLTFQKNRQNQIIQNLKIQLEERDSQIQRLKHVMANIRKVYKNKRQNFNNKRLRTQTGHQQVIPSRQQSTPKVQKDQQNQEEFIGKAKSLSNIMVRYPRMQEKGQKSQMGFKWNHHSFSSKIKEIQILPHQKGHIKAIHVRYQKGEPSKIKGQYSSFVCEQFKEYVKNISGGFKNGLLQFLIVSTNQKRVNKFCRYDIQDQCTKFSFNIKDFQYPCAIFGQNVQEGVVRFGCFIQKLNQKQGYKQTH